MRAQEMRRARALDVERVHVVACGMMLGNIQRFKIVIGRFDLGTFHHAESNRGENAQQLLVGLPD